MRLGRNDVGATTIAVVVLTGVVSVGVLASWAAFASQASTAAASPPLSHARLVAARALTARAAVSPAPTAEATPAPTQAPIRLPYLPARPKLSTPPPTPSQATEPGGPTAASVRAVYAWQDGDTTRRVALQPELALVASTDVVPGDVVVAELGRASVVRPEAGHARDTGPVFRPAAGGALMALPGGVLVVLDPAWDAARIASFFAENGVAQTRTSPLGLLPNGYRISTEPGFAALHLANALAGQDGVVLASPNWWREIAPQ